MQSKAKPVTGPVVVEKAKSFYDGMNITAKCTMAAKIGYCLKIWNI
jgi:hypothetical protein